MSEEILGRQFLARRAAQLKAEGQSLQRPAANTLEGAMARHPAGKRRGPGEVISGGKDEAGVEGRRGLEISRARAQLQPKQFTPPPKRPFRVVE